jgi:hypothetical protein
LRGEVHLEIQPQAVVILQARHHFGQAFGIGIAGGGDRALTVHLRGHLVKILFQLFVGNGFCLGQILACFQGLAQVELRPYRGNGTDARGQRCEGNQVTTVHMNQSKLG